MKKARSLEILFIVTLVFLVSISYADSAYWTCTICGQQQNSGNYCSNCGTARSRQNNSIDYLLEQIPGELNRVKVRLQSVSSNSYIINHADPDLWLPVHAADGDESTCWQFSSQNNALGSVYLDLDIGASETIDSLWIKNGFWSYSQNGADLYTANCRPKRVRVEFLYDYSTRGYGDAVIIELADDVSRKGWQQFDIGRHTRVTGVRLWVLSTYAGSYYKNDVCLSEVMLVQNSTAASAFPPSSYLTPTGNSYGVQAPLLMRLSTRSGPSTRYDEPGTFFQSNWQENMVKVLGKAWDGNIWWVLVDFNYGNASYRVWTGLKRVNVNIDTVPEIYSSGQGTIDATETRRGPGGNYAKGPTITSWQDVVAFGRENGYIEVECYNCDEDRIYRFWVPESKAHIDAPSQSVGW